MELEPFAEERAGTFSRGMAQRLNLARILLQSPRLLLLDEPTASLDNNTKLLVKELLMKLKKEGTSMIGIFHDLEFMEGLCDRVYNISQGHFQEDPKEEPKAAVSSI